VSRRTLEFGCGIVIVGLLAGVAGAATTLLLHAIEHLTYHYSFGSLLTGVGGSSPVRRAVDRMKAEDVDEPLWSGVQSIEDSGSGVTVGFEPAPSPALRRAGGVDVACVLYPDEGP